ATAAAVTSRLASLTGNADVDDVLTSQVDQAAASATTAAGTSAEPRVLAWAVDFTRAANFGRVGGSSGLAGPEPPAGSVVVNAPLAKSLRVRAGDPITLYVYGQPRQLTVERVVAAS